MKFKVKDLDLNDQTVTVNWGWITTSHPLPQSIIDNPRMDTTQMRDLIATLEPEPPESSVLTTQLQLLVQNGLDTPGPHDEKPNYYDDATNQMRSKIF
jgi:hypothetical protein